MTRERRKEKLNREDRRMKREQSTQTQEVYKQDSEGTRGS